MRKRQEEEIRRKFEEGELIGDKSNTEMMAIKTEEVAKGGDASSITFGSKPM